jgi:hypothetical protein
LGSALYNVALKLKVVLDLLWVSCFRFDEWIVHGGRANAGRNQTLASEKAVYQLGIDEVKLILLRLVLWVHM